MLRYARLYLHFVEFSIGRALEFRVDFFFRIVMDIAFYAVNLAFFAILYRHTALIGGWSEDQAYVFVCAYLLADAVFMTVFANNMWWMPIFINRGDLDYYLVRPVSTLFFLSLRDFAANSFINVVIAVGLMVWALARHAGGLSGANVLLFCAYMVVATFIHYLIRMLFIIPVFWLQTSRGLDEISFTLDHLAERPDQIYGAWLRRVLVTALPLAFIASIPTHVLFEGITAVGLLHLVAVVAGLFCFVRWLWSRGLRAYASASS